MKARRVGEIVAVKENESEKDLLNDPLGNRMERRCALFAAACKQIENGRNKYNCDHDKQHYIAVSEEVGLIADRLNP